MRKSDGIVSGDANAHRMAFGEEQTVTFEVNFTKYHTKTVKFAYLCSLSGVVSFVRMIKHYCMIVLGKKQHLHILLCFKRRPCDYIQQLL